jgi:hypothetical protein
LSDNLQPLKFLPGIVKEKTPRAAEPYWIDADKVRFRHNRPELIGGWQNITVAAETTALRGMPREIETIRNLSGRALGLIGTHVGLFSTDFASYYNVTPVIVSASVTDRFNTSIGSNIVVVSVTAHGLTNESLVSFVSASVTIGGNILVNTSAAVTTFYQVSVIGANSFEIIAPVTAAATSTQAGGVVHIQTHYPAGPKDTAQLGGYGAGPYGIGPYGIGSASGRTSFRDWSFDFWGTDLMAVPTSGPLMIWGSNNAPDTYASIITAAPSINNIVRVADSRQVILYGTYPYLSATFDPLLIRWSSQEDYTDWTPTELNEAGEFRLQSRGSTIRSVTKLGNAHAILTASDLHLQNFVGGDDQFGFVRQSENCGVISRKAAVEYNGILYWMSNANQFFMYSGRVETLQCDVLAFVFQNINPLYIDKVRAGVNVDFNEIWWFYPDLTSTGENNRYVIYNIVEKHWSIGAMARTVWHSSRVLNKPVAAGLEGEGLYYHESGWAADTSALSAYLESAYFNGGQDAYILFTDKLVPDFSQADGDTPFDGNITLLLTGRKYPNGEEVVKGPFVVGPATTKISSRMRAREFKLRISSNEINKPWQMGEISMTLTQDGRQ